MFGQNSPTWLNYKADLFCDLLVSPISQCSATAHNSTPLKCDNQNVARDSVYSTNFQVELTVDHSHELTTFQRSTVYYALLVITLA